MESCCSQVSAELERLPLHLAAFLDNFKDHRTGKCLKGLGVFACRLFGFLFGFG